MTAPTYRPPAPAYFIGMQEGFGSMPGFELWNLTETIPGYPVGSSVSRETLIKAGFDVPSAQPELAKPELPAARAAYFAK